MKKIANRIVRRQQFSLRPVPGEVVCEKIVRVRFVKFAQRLPTFEGRSLPSFAQEGSAQWADRGLYPFLEIIIGLSSGLIN